MSDVDLTAAAPAIEMVGVGKRYVKLEEQAMLLRSILPFSKPKRSELWALRDIDLTIAQGETVGILGRNGAGKTTMLRLLAAVTRPSEGTVRIRGRVAPLISVGVGFNREMSGRENVFLNGMLLGLSRAEVEERFDDVVAFAELEDFIDVPVKFYSSGMYMRLGFSAAIHIDPQVLLVDEVLAVGDLTFQLKCLKRMRELQATGTTIVFVSHSVNAIRAVCPRAVVLRNGHLEYDGDAQGAIALHYELLSVQAEERAMLGREVVVGGATLLERVLEGPDGQPTTTLPQHTEIVLRQRMRFDRAVDSPLVALTVVSETGALAYQLLPTFGTRHRVVAAGEEIDIEIRFMNRLVGGTYSFGTKVTSNDGFEVIYQDAEGVYAYAENRLGSVGIAELDAVAVIAGHEVSAHGSLLLDGSGERES